MVGMKQNRNLLDEIDRSRSALLAIELDFAAAALNGEDPDLEAALHHAGAAQELLLEVPPDKRDDLVRRARAKTRQAQGARP